MLEIEIKAYCPEPEKTIEKILALGGKEFIQRTERDIYYNHPSRDFKETDEALRLRVLDNDKTILTYKGPKIGTKHKTRYEEESEILSPDSFKNILNRLGFKFVDEVKKERTIYILRDIEICLDKVEGLGMFVELEKKGDDAVQGETELSRLADDLGLTEFEVRSYLELKLLKQA